MFTQSVYSNIDDAKEQLQDYFAELGTTRGWNSISVTYLQAWVTGVHNRNSHWYGDDVQQFWTDIANEYDENIKEATGGNPDILQNWQGIGRVLGSPDMPPDPNRPAGETVSPASISADVEAASGLSGAVNVAQEQIEEFAAEQARRNERYERLAPFIIPAVALGAFYILVK